MFGVGVSMIMGGESGDSASKRRKLTGEPKKTKER